MQWGGYKSILFSISFQLFNVVFFFFGPHIVALPTYCIIFIGVTLKVRATLVKCFAAAFLRVLLVNNFSVCVLARTYTHTSPHALIEILL